MDLSWSHVKLVRGVYDFEAAGYSGYVDQMLAASPPVRPYLILSYGNTLYDRQFQRKSRQSDWSDSATSMTWQASHCRSGTTGLTMVPTLASVRIITARSETTKLRLGVLAPQSLRILPRRHPPHCWETSR